MTQIKQVLIPAAGRGARLDRPGTPKPLVDVGGVPLLERLLSQFEVAGVERAVIVVGYAAPKIIRELTRHPDLGLQLEFVEHLDWESGQAGSILAARDALDPEQPFLLAMSDHVFDASLVELMSAQAHEPGGVVALCDPRLSAVFDLASAVKISRQGEWILAIERDLARPDAVDCGLFVADHGLFAALEKAREHNPAAELTDALSTLCSTGRVRAVETGQAAWDDIDTPAALIHAEMRLRRSRRRSGIAGVPGPAPASMQHYRFKTGATVGTDVIIGRGLVKRPGSLPLIPDESASSPIFVFTDQTVNRLYGEQFVAGLRSAGYDVHAIVMADGEESKTLSNYLYLVERVLGRGIDERSILISLGGGAVCNVCGLVASTLYRGIGLVHVPTTLMAQCDAAISHKQGVNGARGKNLVGSYYAPKRIIVDIDVLATLDGWLIHDGLAEVLKHALGQDADYARMLLDYRGELRDPDFLEAVVRRNVELKCLLMADDPKEMREGMVLQYGHTVGHPVEYQSGYTLYHGQAVAIGMMVAARVARLLGACTDELVDLHEQLIRQYQLPVHIPHSIGIDDIIETMSYNKRYLTEGHRMALLDGLGSLWRVDSDYVIPVSEAVLRRALRMSYKGGCNE